MPVAPNNPTILFFGTVLANRTPAVYGQCKCKASDIRVQLPCSLYPRTKWGVGFRLTRLFSNQVGRSMDIGK